MLSMVWDQLLESTINHVGFDISQWGRWDELLLMVFMSIGIVGLVVGQFVGQGVGSAVGIVHVGSTPDM